MRNTWEKAKVVEEVQATNREADRIRRAAAVVASTVSETARTNTSNASIVAATVIEAIAAS